MKILIDARSISKYNAGIGTYALNIIKNLNKKNKYILWKNYNVNIDSSFKKINNYIPGRMLKKLWRRYSFPSLELLTLQKYDIYHSFEANIPPNKCKKVIITVHDLAYKIDDSFYPIKYKKEDEEYFQKILDNADKIISVSNNTKLDLLKYYNIESSKISVVYNGVDDKYKTVFSEKEKEIVREKYNLPEKFLLFVGTIEPRKNINRLLNAYMKLDKELRIKYPLVIVGKDGWESKEVLEKLNKLCAQNDIIRLGYIDFEDLPIIYQLSSVFVYLSLYEGFGLPVLEAMSSGVPVITSNNSSLGELFDGFALTCNPYSENEIYNALDNMLTSKKTINQYTQLSIKRAKDFSWLNTSREIEKIYDELENI